MSIPDLLYSDTEDQLRASVRALLSDRCSPEAVAAAYDAPGDFSALWKALAAELGIAALLVPEELGGAGASAREAAVVAEEIGRAVAPVPFLSSAVLATVALHTAGEKEVLSELAAGTTTAALVVPLSNMDLGRPPVRSEIGEVTGTVRTVAGAEVADVLVVPAVGPGGIELHTVRCDAAGVTVTAVPSLDMSRRLTDVEFAGAASARVTPDARSAVAAAMVAGSAVLAAEQLGVANWCFDAIIAYVKQRRQFGREIGSFQAIKHRLADLWLEINQAGAAARYAADAHARGDNDVAVAAAVARAYCGPVAVHAAEECVQLHGGIGMTWEHPAHLYLKRAKADQLALGRPYQHRTRLAQLVNLPPC